jgi:PAS domain S-box-containing protein
VLLSLTGSSSVDQLSYQEAEGFVRSALNAMSAHIAILDEDGVILEVNSAWRQFADDNGFDDPTYGIGTNYLVICEAATVDDARSVARGIRQVIGLMTDEFYLEYPCHSPTERRWYVVRVTRFEWYGHVRLIVAHQNVTELKRVQVELAESRARIQAIVDNVVDGIVTTDRNGIITMLNPAAASIFGCDQPGGLIGQGFAALLDERYAGGGSSYMAALTVTASSQGHEIVGRRCDGTLFPMYIAMTRVKIDGRTMYTGIVQDITERKRLQAELLDKERLNVALEKERELRLLKDRFISMMSHELRTPLASIQLAADMLRKYGDRASEAEKRESLDTIEAQVRSLSELVSDVMTISKTEFMGETLNLETLDLETYLRDILEELTFVHYRRHNLIFSGVDRRVEASIDRKLLRRTLVNLLSNAIKYSPAGGEVRLELALAGREAVIRVSDQGIGIPPEDLPRLFEPFHRAANVEGLPGTGLGLVIAKQSVEMHGGSLSVESAIGQGTTFTVRLPLAGRALA